MTEKEKVQQVIVDEYVEILLAKDNFFDDDLLGVDCLDSPVKELILEIKVNSKISFEIMRVVNGQVRLGGVYLTPAKYYVLKDGMSKQQYWIRTTRIRQLLLDNSHKSIFRDTVNGESFLVLLDRQLLLDNAELEKAST